ncbi:MAG: LCP family protein [Chloroflexota bacterium]
MKTNPSERRPRAAVRLPLWALILLALLFLGLSAFSTIWLFQTMRDLASAWEVSAEPDFGTVVEPEPDTLVAVSEPEITTNEASDPLIPVPDVLDSWAGTERVSILLLGIDQRCDEDGPTHTDTMMVASLEPLGKSLTVLSLPRDLWVEIPGFEVDRINQAYYLGQAYEYPGGGQALAIETVESVLGVPIHHYIAINFDAFIESVDLIGGITVDVPEAIDDPSYPDRCYGYDPFRIEAGEQQLDGASALKYARTRATFGGDVDRAGRQQAVILAIRDQITQLDMLPQLIAQSPQLWQTFQKNVRTDLTLNEIVQLALLGQEISRENIQTAVIDYSYVYNETTPDGRQVLVPNREEIRRLRERLFAPPAIPTPTVEDLPDLMLNEEARVAVFNGTAVFGLAAATQEYLQSQNVNVTEIGNADSATYQSTQIIDYGSHPHTTLYLVQQMDIPPLNVSSGSDPDGPYDILIILGNDWQLPVP